MTLRAFIGIIVAVALGVNRWLKIHENPESFDNLLELIWILIKFLVKLWLFLLIIWWIGYSIYLWIDRIWNRNWNISIPDRVVGTASLIIFGWLLIASFLITIKEKWWFKARLKEKKEKRIARKKEIANLKWEEKKKYEKRKKDRIIIIICLGIILSPGIIITILSLFWADI